MSSSDNDNNIPRNKANPDDTVRAAGDNAEARADVVAPAGKPSRAWIYWCAAGVVIIGGVVLCTVMATGVASSAIKGRMSRAGLENPEVKVESAGPFFARISDLSFSANKGAVKVSKIDAMADYSPLSVLGRGELEDAIIEKASVDVDLKAFASGGSGASIAKIPFALPVVMDALPVHGLLVRGAEVNIISGGIKQTMRIDALARKVTGGDRSATISATGENGDQILVTLQPKDGGETVNAEGSVDPLGWYLALVEAAGKNLPQNVGLEAAPLVVQLVADIEGGKPGKWVWVVSQPWFQINNGPVVVSSQDARAGFTGNGDKLVKASAEGDLLLKTGNLTIGPFHTVARISDDGILAVNAERVPLQGLDCSMVLDYCRLATSASAARDDFSMRGVVKPSWFPVDLTATVTFSENLDGVFATVSLPRTVLKDVPIPDGWLPASMNKMRISGGIDADLYLSVGGLSAGGFASSGRISSDNASFVIPVSVGKAISFNGVRMRNARFTSSGKGFSVDIPDGFMASKVEFGGMLIDDLQLWPGRVSIPGDASLDSATANVFGGRLVVGGVRGKISKAGVFVPSSSFEVKVGGADLSMVAQQFKGVKMSGALNVSARVTPVVDDAGVLRVGVKSSLDSRAFSFSLPGGFSLSAKDLEAEFAFENTSKESGLHAKLEFSNDLLVNSFAAPGVAYDGKAYVRGWAETSSVDIIASLVRGPLFAGKADLSAFFDGGDLKLSGLGATLSGVRGRIEARLGSDNPSVSCDGPMEVASIDFGNLKISNVKTKFAFSAAGLTLDSLTGTFCDGSFKLLKFAKEGDGYAFSVSMEGVSASALAALFPQFKGKVSGVLDGELGFFVEAGSVEIRPGEIHMRGSSSGRFSYPDVDAILSRMGRMDEMVRSRAANTIGDMRVTAFSINISGDKTAPVVIRIAGDAVDGNGVPVDARVALNGDVSEAIGMAIGKGVKVSLGSGGGE